MSETRERKPPQKRLSKQNEIDDEGGGDGEDNSPSSDQSDTTLTAGPDTPGLQSSPESPTNKTGSMDEGRHDSSSPEQANKNNQSHSKGNKLQRSQALSEDDSPPPDGTDTVSDGGTPRLKPVKMSRAKLEKNGSGSQSSEAGTSSSLSRDSSTDAPYMDSSGIDLEEFIKMTLNRTPKDRQMLLQLEKDLLSFIREKDHHYLKFPPMSSYNRMLVHRIAAFFGLDHNIDQTGKAVIVNKTSNTREPEFNFGDHIRGNGGPLDVPRRLLKRDGGRGGDKPHLNNDKRTKSLEERQYDYSQARARIFQQDSDRSTYSDGHMDGLTVSSLHGSKEDMRLRDMRPWSSTDSSGYSTDSSFKARQPMTKASSFGGVPSAIMTRPVIKGPSLSKTDSFSSGVSSLGSPLTRPPAIPSSPSNQSDASILSGSSSSGPIYSPPQPIIIEGGTTSANSSSYPVSSGAGPSSTGQQSVYWVASNVESIAPGSIIINPQTGQPYVNPDGTLYRYHPNQPLPGSPATTPAQPPQPHPVYAQPTLISVDRSHYPGTDLNGSRDLCQQVSSFTISSPPGGEPGGEAPQSVRHGPTVIYTSMPPSQQGTSQQPQVIMQQPTYYPSGQASVGGGQQVRYMYPVGYVSGPQGQTPMGGSMDSQGQQPASISQGTGHQYSTQPYVASYPGYPGITYQPVPCQSTETYPAAAAAYPQAVDYPTAHTDSALMPHYSQYPTPASQYPTPYNPQHQPGNYVQPQQQQQTVGPQGPIYYTVPASSPQPAFTFNSQGLFRPTSPPSQASVPSPNQSMPVNVGQPVAITTPAPLPTQHHHHPTGNSVNISTPQYFPYPAGFTQLTSPQRAQTPGQVVQYHSVPQHSAVGQTSFPIVRPNMQIGMQMASQGLAPGMATAAGMQQAIQSTAGPCTMKGYMFDPRLSKSPEMPTGPVVEGGPAVFMGGQGYCGVGPGSVVSPVRPGGGVPPFRPPNPVTGDVRLYGQPMPGSGMRPQIQTLQLAQRPRFPSQPGNMYLAKPQRQARRPPRIPGVVKDSVCAAVPVSCEDLPKGSHVLEVCDLPLGLSQTEAGKLLEELVSQGAAIQYYPRNKCPSTVNANTPLADLTVLAIFPQGPTAHQVLQTHSNVRFRLRSTLNGNSEPCMPPLQQTTN